MLGMVPVRKLSWRPEFGCDEPPIFARFMPRMPRPTPSRASGLLLTRFSPSSAQGRSSRRSGGVQIRFSRKRPIRRRAVRLLFLLPLFLKAANLGQADAATFRASTDKLTIRSKPSAPCDSTLSMPLYSRLSMHDSIPERKLAIFSNSGSFRLVRSASFSLPIFGIGSRSSNLSSSAWFSGLWNPRSKLATRTPGNLSCAYSTSLTDWSLSVPSRITITCRMLPC